MTVRSLISQLFRRPAGRPIRQAPPRSRPAVEALEDRCVPAIVVTTPLDAVADDGLTSLREAIGLANNHAGVDTIQFDTTVFNTAQIIKLSGSELQLLDSATTTITGPAAGVTISGENASRVFLINSGASAELSGLTITRGKSSLLGGGLFIDISAVLRLDNCTVSGNSALTGGGGLFNAGTATLTNCTFSTNAADFNFAPGGGLDNHGTGTLSLTNCTISGNTVASSGHAGGMSNASGASFRMTNTIVAKNSGGPGGDAHGTYVSGGNNLIGKTDGSTGWGDSDLKGSGFTPLDPLMTALGDYGGPTQTMALLPGSPALNAGTSTGATSTDQRGVSRVRKVDIGAFESRGFTLAVTSGSGQSTRASTTFATPLVVMVIANDASEPVEGGRVTFTPPLSGASAFLPSSADIGADGTASVTASANDIGGTYAVKATAPGITPASFSLTNGPRVVSIRRLNPNPTTATLVRWRVTFSDAVTGVNLRDFRLVQTNGLTGASLVSVVGSGSVWTVTARTGTRPGKLGLNLKDDDSIQDVDGTKLGGTGAANGDFTGAIYTRR